jgi:hypothetical protein
MNELSWLMQHRKLKDFDEQKFRNNPNPVHSLVKGYALVGGRWFGKSD